MPDHDGDYKVIFSYPETVEALLRGFVRERWVERLDFSTLERVNASHVSERLRARHGDTVWKLRFQDGKGQGPWLYVYLLLEFQSTPYPFMPVRMLGYVAGLLEDLIKEEKLKAGDRLPAVLPLVIYSGKRPWSGPTELGRLFSPAIPRELRRRLPRLDFLLLDESRLSAEELGQAENLTAGIFRVETATPGELLDRAEELAPLIPPRPELRRAIMLWMGRTLQRQLPGVTIPEGLELEEIAMIEETLKEWREQMVREAKEEGWSEGWRGGRKEGEELGMRKGQELGRREGRKEGELGGMRRLLLQVLEQRFGPLPSPVEARVAAISSAAALQRLARRALTAESLADLRLPATE